MAPRQMLDGFESSRTNIASDQGAGNDRRSIARTLGRSEYVRRRISGSIRSPVETLVEPERGRAEVSPVLTVIYISRSKLATDLRIREPQIHRVHVSWRDRL